MKRVISIMVIALALVFLMEVGSGWAEEYEKVLVPTKTGEWMELTLVPEEIINFGTLEILRNTMDPSNVISREGWLVECGSLGDKVKDYFLIPIYDVNDILVKYWAIGYYGEGQMKNLEEIIASLWYPNELWEKEELYFYEVRDAKNILNKEDLIYEEYRQIVDLLKEKHKSIQDNIYSYINLNVKDYLNSTVGAYYEIPPGQKSAETGFPYFIESYWNKYYHVNKQYQTDDIEFVGFVYNSECRIMLKFRVGNNYVYTNSSVDELNYPTEIIEQDKFEGFDLYKATYDCVLFKYADSKKRIWDSIIEKYFEDKEKY